VVLEATGQYWKPVWLDREPHLEKLHLPQAQSNRAPQGRQLDFRDAKRLGRRRLAGELMLSFVPEPEQRAWRRRTRGRLPVVCERVRLPNQVEALREEARIKPVERGQRLAGREWTAHSGGSLARGICFK
jgi:hypothetical protein